MTNGNLLDQQLITFDVVRIKYSTKRLKEFLALESSLYRSSTIHFNINVVNGIRNSNDNDKG